MGIPETIALSMGAAWASGINLYATILMLGIMQATGNIVLPQELQILQNPLVLASAGLMYVVEFFADKVPGVDNMWDTLHTFIRIPAGALLAAGAMSDVSPAAEFAGLLLGGSLSASTHLTKSGSRVLINTSPEPVSNWFASLGEDIAVLAGLLTALKHPWVFLVLLVIFLVLLVWLLPRLWRAIKFVFTRLGGWLSGRKVKSGPGEGGMTPSDSMHAPPATRQETDQDK